MPVNPERSATSRAQADENRPDEYALLRRIGDRDAVALEELYQVYANSLYSYAYRMLTDQQDTEEVLQDTFVRIWKRAPKYDPKISKPLTWTIMILRGLCMDRLRRRATRAKLKSVPLASVGDVGGGKDDSITDLYFSELSRRVKAALAVLPEKERLCVELAVFGEITHVEIAERLGEPLGTVKSRIRRGMVKLRQLLKNKL